MPDISSVLFPQSLEVVLANMLYIPKRGISQSGLNRLKRLACFKNPDFYKAQAMRMSTFDKPRIISLAEEDERYIMLPREGFDEPRLDTLFLALPISRSGTLSQYVGRLHREYEGKKAVQIYDYIDLSVPMLGNMYKKRLRGYAKLGYAPEERSESGFKTIYSGNFEADLFRDIQSAKKSIMLAGTYFPPRQINMLINAAENCRLNGARFVIVTKRSESPYAQKTEQLISFHGIDHIVKNRIANSFCIIDGRTVWYSSGELFGIKGGRKQWTTTNCTPNSSTSRTQAT